MEQLFEALADLDDGGGIAGLADAELWPEVAVARAIDDMNLIRRMLRTEVARLRGLPPVPDDPGSEARSA